MSRKKEVDTMELGKRIRKLRESKGLMQYQLAEAAGIKPLAMIRIEFGRTTPTVDTLRGIARALDVKIDELIGG